MYKIYRVIHCQILVCDTKWGVHVMHEIKRLLGFVREEDALMVHLIMTTYSFWKTFYFLKLRLSSSLYYWVVICEAIPMIVFCSQLFFFKLSWFWVINHFAFLLTFNQLNWIYMYKSTGILSVTGVLRYSIKAYIRY